jgi:uncharacterized membrane protein YcaP (DUF421 family)
MFDMQVPWWELIARAAMVYFAVLLMVRLSGKRTIGEFSPFDVIVVLLLAECAQGSLTGDETSVQGGLIAIATLVALNYGIAFIATRSNRMESLIEGDPVTLIRDGVKREEALRKNNIPEGDLAEAMRAKGIKHESEVEWAVLEADGEISFFKREGKKSKGKTA